MEQRRRLGFVMRPSPRAIAYGAFVVVAVLNAFWSAYGWFSSYDDEGYVLLSIREFMRLGGLYTHVYSQYGPFPFELWGAVYKIFGTSPTPDNARILVLVMWVGTSLAIGLIAERVSSSTVVGIIAASSGFTALSVITKETLIPDDLCAVLAVCVLGAAAFNERRPRLRLALIGGLVGCLIMTKINIGGAVFLAACYSVAVTSRALRRWPQIHRTLIVVGMLVPVVVMRQDLNQSWAQNTCLMIVLAIGAIAVTFWRGQTEALATPIQPGRDYLWYLGGVIGAVVVIVVVIIALGTSPHALIDGLIVWPLNQRDSFTVNASIPIGAIYLGAAGLLGAIVASRERDRQIPLWLQGGARVIIGATLLLELSGVAPLPFRDPGALSVGLPFLWLAARPPQGVTGRQQTLARLLVAALPAFAALGIYPVAGTQVGYASVLLVPASAVILVDGARQLRADRAPWLYLGLNPRSTLRVAGAVLLALLAYQSLLQATVTAATDYRGFTSFPFKGAGEVRQPSQFTSGFASVVNVLKSHCSSFITEPGMDSFYLWSGIEPPTGWNATAWMYLFSSAQQQKIVNAVRNTPRLCLVTNDQLLEFWEGGRPLPQRPLVGFIASQRFRSISSTFGYTVWIRHK